MSKFLAATKYWATSSACSNYPGNCLRSLRRTLNLVSIPRKKTTAVANWVKRGRRAAAGLKVAYLGSNDFKQFCYQQY